ncbi:MAG: hypothetical protein LBE62_02790, partial [Azonexus sp.]|nr:hypothetical protein [Azonexus sp.]
MNKKRLLALLGGLLCANAHALHSVLDDDYGFYKGADFTLQKGDCAACIDKAESFYFKEETLAVPKNKSDLAFFWNNPELIAEGYLTDDGLKFREISGQEFDFAVIGKIPANLSYYDASSVGYLSGQKLIVKGEVKDGALIARSIWPESWRLPDGLVIKALGDKSIYDLVRDKNASDKTLT